MTRWVISSLILASLTACGGRDEAPQAVASGGTAVYCISSLPEQLNTFVTPDLTAADLRWLLFTPLVRYAADGTAVEPWLATSWHWDDAGLVVTIALRSGVTWHDGEPLDASDVVWTVRAAGNTEYGYVGSDDLAGLIEATVVTSDTVRLTFDRTMTAGMEPFVHLPILPQHLLDTIPAAGFARSPYHREPTGSGPWRFVERTVDGSVVLGRNDAFPEALGRPDLDRLVLRAVPEATSALVELETGNVEACAMGSSRAADIDRSQRLRAIAVPPVGLYAIPLDMRRPPLDDARVRRALSAALDRRSLAASMSSAMRPARTFLPPDSRWEDPAALQPDADTALANALLEEAGWRRGANGLRVHATGTPLRFTLVGPQPHQILLTAVQAQWRAVGADVELRFLEGAAYVSTIRNPDTRPQAMSLAFFPDRLLTPDPGSQLHSRGGSNLSSYSVPEVDRLTESLSTPLDDAARAEAYHALQRRVAEDVPLIYAIHAPRLLAVSDELEGVMADANGPLAGIATWRLAPRP